MSDDKKRIRKIGLALPDKCVYRTVVADPPWHPSLHANNPRRRTLDKAGPQKYYDTLTVAEIASLVPPTASVAHVYVWAVNQHLEWAYQVVRAWGFEPVQLLTWCKPGLGVGRFQCNTEQVIVGRKGGRQGNQFGPPGRAISATPGTWFHWPRGRHSEKPAEFYTLVEYCSPAPRLEMFARTLRPGWDVWGNEVDGLTAAKGEV